MTNRFHRLAAVVVSLGAATAATAIAFEHFDLHIALTDSAAPPGIYQMRSHSRLSRELVAACLPSDIARLATSRGYLSVSPLSDCPELAAPIGKLVLALPGDELQIKPDFIVINGHRFARSATAVRDNRGRILRRMRAGQYRVPPGSVRLFGFSQELR